MVLDFLKKLASDLGGRAIAIKPKDQALYRISAVMICGYLVALLNAATHLWSEMGITRDKALSAMLPMARERYRHSRDRPPDARGHGHVKGAPASFG